MAFVLASNNPGKLKEFEQLFTNLMTEENHGKNLQMVYHQVIWVKLDWLYLRNNLM